MGDSISSEEINLIKRNSKHIYIKYHNYIVKNNNLLTNEKFLGTFWNHFFTDSQSLVNKYKPNSPQKRIATECMSAIQICLELISM